MTTNAVKTYDAYFFRQRPKSPVQCTFVATSADIHDWASVPTKTAADLRNFQRAEIESHVQDIREFFQKYEENCSPSSITLGFNSGVQCTFPDGQTEIRFKEYGDKKFGDVPPGLVVVGKIKISYLDPFELNKKQKRAALKDLLARRIDISKSRLEGLVSKHVQSAIDTSTEDSPLEDSQFDSQAIEELEEVLEEHDEEMSVAYDSSTIANELEAFVAQLEGIDVDKLEDNEVLDQLLLLLDMSKPGLIIDGQHRVRGTKDEKILFTVTALPDSEWPELAFQFIVLNKAARPVPDRLLINIIGNSLSEEELPNVEKRLTDSGVPVPLYQGVMKLHEDPESPFWKKLKFGIEGETGIIDAASAKNKIVNFWFSGNRIYPLIRHMLDGKLKAEKILYWQSTGLWYEFLKCFWNTAKRFYEPSSSLWSNTLESDGKTPVSKLMRVTIIDLTQQAIIEVLLETLSTEIKNDINQQKTMESLLPDIEAFEKYVEFYFKRLKPDFFSDWGSQAKGFDGSKTIKEEYKKAVKLVISGDRDIDTLKKDGTKQHLLYRNK